MSVFSDIEKRLINRETLFHGLFVSSVQLQKLVEFFFPPANLLFLWIYLYLSFSLTVSISLSRFCGFTGKTEKKWMEENGETKPWKYIYKQTTCYFQMTIEVSFCFNVEMFEAILTETYKEFVSNAVQNTISESNVSYFITLLNNYHCSGER